MEFIGSPAAAMGPRLTTSHDPDLGPVPGGGLLMTALGEASEASRCP